MHEYIVNCPCCEEKLKISIDGSGNATTFLLEQNKISQKKLSKDFDIELGIVESNEEVN